MSTEKFFKKRTDWARRKHLILTYYLDPAIKKLRYASPDRRVFILDGFAGRGRYEEGSQGSPIYTGELAEKCREGINPLNLFVRNTEPDEGHFEELERSTESWVRQGYVKNLNGTFQMTLPQVLADAGNSPLFAFLDPFKPTQLKFNDFLPLLHRQAKTEACAVFFTRMVQRNLQALRSSKSDPKFRESLSETMTQVFGGEGWKDLVADNALGYESILNLLAQQVMSHARIGYSGEPGFVVYKPIYAARNGHMKYHIVFWTRHLDGLVLMNDAFVKEAGDLDEITEKQIALATEQKLAGQGLLDFNDPDEPSKKDIEAAEQFKSLCETYLEIGRAMPSRTWTRSTLIEQAIQHRFGQFNKTKHRRAIEWLVDKPVAPKIVPINSKQNKSGKWALNDETTMRFEYS